MARLTREGRFKATIRESAVCVSKKSKLPQFEAQFDISMEMRAGEWVDISDDNFEIRCWYGLAKKNGEIIQSKVDNLKDSLGWDGVSLQSLNDHDYRGHLVQLTCGFGKDEDGQAKNDIEVFWINPADSSGGGVQKPDASEMKSLDAIWGPKLRSLAPSAPAPKPAAKPATAPSSKPPASAPPSGPPKSKAAAATGTLDGAWALCESIWAEHAKKGRDIDQNVKDNDWWAILSLVNPNKEAESFSPEDWGRFMQVAPGLLAEMSKIPF